jgi:hypothetical protein
MQYMNIIILGLMVILLGTVHANTENLIAWWKFDNDQKEIIQESVQGVSDTLVGFKKYIPGISGKALLFDGYTSFIKKSQGTAPSISGPFTIEAWIAFQAYPWNWVAIVDQLADTTAGYQLAVNANGYLRLQVVVDGKLRTILSDNKIELLNWAHIVGTFDPEQGLTLYIDGAKVGELSLKGKLNAAKKGNLQIGKSFKKLPPAYPIRMDLPASYSFDGIIDEVKIYQNALGAGDIASKYKTLKPDNNKVLSFRKLPTGSDGPGRFGAYYVKLEFSDTWDDPWRVGEYADVVVRFDREDYKFIFWRGTSYIPFWVTETGVWYTNEFNETWGEDVMGCAEPMSDKKARQSHVRIIESNDARVVVHWRYALVDNREIIAKVDPVSGWGDWSDEYYTIYPDGVGTRKIHLWSSAPTKPHQFQEAIILNPPGTKPEDNIEVDAITMMNMKGETHTYSWAEGAPDVIDKPAHFNIQFINLKSKSRPFIIVNEGKPSVTRRNIETDGPWLRPYSGEINREYSIFPWWNHWPVAQIPSDGRWATEPDRVSHSSLSNDLEWKEIELTERSHVRVMMHGLTDKSPDEILPLAKSWLYPAELKLEDDAYRFDQYNDVERAYILEKNEKQSSSNLKFQLAAKSDVPLYNPAFIVKNWGDSQAILKINSREVTRGKKFRYGHRHRLEGSDLIVWLDYKSSDLTEFELIPIN